ncbi:hypothetical protein A2U01_0089503, partial [Trifolium medium]|nr:hypothetical protein [Trifolium medium]
TSEGLQLLRSLRGSDCLQSL